MKAKSIAGWCEGAALTWLAAEAAKHQRIVELGVWKGKSTACLAEHTTGTVYAIDHFCGNEHGRHTVFKDAQSEAGRQAVIAETKANLKEWLDSGRVVLLEMSGEDALPLLPDLMGGPADMVFIDGSHDYEDVKRDILGFRDILRSGGILSGHDVGWPGVDRAIAELCPGWQRPEKSCVWWKIVPIRTTPWLTPAAIRFLEEILRPECRVLEFGSGGSTIWLSERVAELRSIEHYGPWAEQVQAEAPEATIIVADRPYHRVCEKFVSDCFDLVLVDGRDRVLCCIAAARIIKPGGWLVLDNAERSRYAEVHEHFRGWPHRSMEEREGAVAAGSEGNVWKTDFWQKP